MKSHLTPIFLLVGGIAVMFVASLLLEFPATPTCCGNFPTKISPRWSNAS